MAKIETPLTNEIAARGIMNTTPGVSIGSISQASSDISRQTAALTGTALGIADDYRRQYDRAKLVAQENSFLNVLTNTIPEVIDEVRGTVENATNLLTAIDEQEYEKELKFIEDMYLLDTTGKVEDSYKKMYEQYGSNPMAMMEWLNTTIKEDLVKAPSKKAQFKYMGQMYRFKYVAQQEALDAAAAARAAQRAEALARQEGRAAAALFDYPDDLKTFMNKVPDYERIVRNEGGTPEQVAQYSQGVKQKFVDSAIKGMIHQGRADEALKNIGSNDIRQFLNPELITKYTESATLQLLKRERTKKKEAKQVLDMENFSKGFLQEGLPGANDGSYLHFQSFITDTFDGGTNIGPDTFQSAASDLSSYFFKYNTYMGSDTRSYITGRIKTSNNAYEVATYALAMDNLINDDTFKGLNVGASFAKGDKEAVAEAMSISNLIRAGEDPVQVIQKVRQDLREQNPAKTQAREAQIKEYLDTGGIFNTNKPKSIVEDMFDTPWFTDDPVNTNEMVYEYENTFRDYYKLTGDLEVAKKATKAQMSRTYRPSTINGRSEVMFGAPELYFPDRMDEFNSQYTSALKSLTESAGGKMIDDRNAEIQGRNIQYELRAVRGRTDKQEGKKTYLVFDRNTGRPLLGKDKQYIQFSFGIDSEEEIKIKQQYNYDRLNRVDPTLVESDEQTKNRYLESESFKNAIQDLPDSLKNDIIRNVKRY